jgi:hypothetical protein
MPKIGASTRTADRPVDPTAMAAGAHLVLVDHRHGASTSADENRRAGTDPRGRQGAVCSSLGGVQTGGEGLGFREALTYILAMLRMRKKPPADMPDINSDKPWSEMDLRDLELELKAHRPVAEIAEFLCRDIDEVEAKIASRN